MYSNTKIRMTAEVASAASKEFAYGKNQDGLRVLHSVKFLSGSLKGETRSAGYITLSQGGHRFEALSVGQRVQVELTFTLMEGGDPRNEDEWNHWFNITPYPPMEETSSLLARLRAGGDL